MPSKLLPLIAKEENFCCPYGYLVAHADLTLRKHARIIGVVKETLRKWRRGAADGTYTCQRSAHCLCSQGLLTEHSAPLRWKGPQA